MTNTITYHSTNAPAGQEWMAYVILPNWQRWGVYASASTEEEAIRKIVALYESEKARPINPWPDMLAPKVTSQVANNQHHLAGKVWLINKQTRDKCRVEVNVAEHMLRSGDWERGGPRSK